MEKLEITEIKILQKILGSIKDGEWYTRCHNNELYSHVEKMQEKEELFSMDTSQKINTHKCLQEVDTHRLTGRIFRYYRNSKWVIHELKKLQKIELQIHDGIRNYCFL